MPGQNNNRGEKLDTPILLKGIPSCLLKFQLIDNSTSGARQFHWINSFEERF